MKNGHGSILNENKSRQTKMWKTDNRGTSMITVIISFALLLLLITGYFQIQRLVENIMMNSKDIAINNNQLISAFYLEETHNQTVADGAVLEFNGDEGSFAIEVNLNQASKDGLNGSIYYFGEKKEEPAE